MGEHDQDDKWCKHSLRQVNADSTEGEVDTDTENMQTSNENIELSRSVEDFKAALYTDNDGEIQWYIWKIKETDQNDKEVYITFMTTSEIKGKMTFVGHQPLMKFGLNTKKFCVVLMLLN